MLPIILGVVALGTAGYGVSKCIKNEDCVEDIKDKFKLWGMIFLLSLVISLKLLFVTMIVVLSIIELIIIFYKMVLISISVSNEVLITFISSVKMFWFLWLFILGLILSISLVHLVYLIIKSFKKK